MAMIPPRKRSIETGEMDITPMIDCTFLLLIFFLLTSSSSSKSAVPLPSAHHGAEAAEADAIIITVARTPNGDPQIFLADDSKPNHEAVGSPEDQDAAIKKYLTEENAKVNKAGKQKNNVLIKAAVGLKQRDVDRVEKAVAKAEIEVQYLYLGVSDKK
ncbi:MAG: biopolymer transporter ExbD [Pirellulaceae bacterium]